MYLTRAFLDPRSSCHPPQRLGTRAPGCLPHLSPLRAGSRPSPMSYHPYTDHTPFHRNPQRSSVSFTGSLLGKQCRGRPGGTPSTCPHGILESTERGHSHQRTPEKAQPGSQASLPRAGGCDTGTPCCRGPCLPWVGGGHTAAGAPTQAGPALPAFSSSEASFPAKTVASGTVWPGTCKPTSSTTVPSCGVQLPYRGRLG